MEENKQEITVVHKGLFYGLFYVICLPFKLLFWLLKIFGKHLGNVSSDFKEYQIYAKKKKDLNKILSMRRFDEEII